MNKQNIRKKDFVNISEGIFERFQNKEIPILQKKPEKPKEYEEIKYSEEIEILVTAFREQVLRCVKEMVITKVGKVDVSPKSQNPILFTEQGREYTHFHTHETEEVLTRPQFIEFLANLNQEDDFQYIAPYIMQHIEWEILWKLLSRHDKRKLGKISFQNWKTEFSAFVKTDFPAQTLNNFLEQKKSEITQN